MSLRALSKTEREVMALVAAGMSTAAIAEKRGVSLRTVQCHAAAGRRKLGITPPVRKPPNRWAGRDPVEAQIKEQSRAIAAARMSALVLTLERVCAAAEGLLLSGGCVGPVASVSELSLAVRDARRLVAGG